MNTGSMTGMQSAFTALRRLARPSTAAEQCEFCSKALLPGHRHLFEPATRKLICACDPCALRFENVVGRWKLVPRDPLPLTGVGISDAQWASLSLPIQLAFFFESSVAGRVIAMYPSPAGATESLLPLKEWKTLAGANPSLSHVAPDVQALLVNRLGPQPEEWIAPIDLCFELVGLIRVHWRGFSGGDKVWLEVGSFFKKLAARTPGAVSPQLEAAHA